MAIFSLTKDSTEITNRCTCYTHVYYILHVFTAPCTALLPSPLLLHVQHCYHLLYCSTCSTVTISFTAPCTALLPSPLLLHVWHCYHLLYCSMYGTVTISFTAPCTALLPSPLLLHVQHCYHLQFTNKIQDSLRFKEYYWDDRIKPEK